MIVITGASKGVGKFLFEQFTSLDYEVIGTYNSSCIASKDLSKVDVVNFDQVSGWIERERRRLNNITLVNCAGVTYSCFAHKADPVEWKKVIDVNIIGTFNTIRCLLPIMRNQKYGRIINISSVAAQKPTPGVSAYSASKSALWGLAKAISAEVGTLNITINNINLGYADTGMGIEGVSNEYQQIIKTQIPSGRFCDLIDVFRTILFLMETSYINGTSVDLNGGLI